jgi:membrane protease YdiL (CAAX protease family)
MSGSAGGNSMAEGAASGNGLDFTSGEVPPQPPSPPSRILKIFIGPDGLRAGWRLLIYLATFAALYAGLSMVVQLIHPKPFPLMWLLLVGDSLLLVSALLPVLVMMRLESRRFGDYGLPLQEAFGRLFWIGWAWGLASLTLLMILMRAARVFYFGSVTLHGVRMVKFALFYAVAFLIVAQFEEFWVRGYSLFTLATGIGFWPAAVVLSIAFGAIHLGNKNEAPTGALAAGLIGLFFCLTLRRTGNLWFAIGFHASWDWGETFLYSVPNSGIKMPGHLLSSSFQGPTWLTGGSVGPEGSLLLFVVIAILALVFHRLYREAKFLPPGQMVQRNALIT